MPRSRRQPAPIMAVLVTSGDYKENINRPDGREYHIQARVPFEVAPEDVEWFFEDWDERRPGTLLRLEDWVPTQNYSDPRNPFKPRTAALPEEDEPEPVADEEPAPEPVSEDEPFVFSLDNANAEAPAGEPESEE